MKRQEAQRRILDVLVWASDKGVGSDDEVLAEELGVDRRIVLGNLQLLEEAYPLQNPWVRRDRGMVQGVTARGCGRQGMG